MTAVVKTRYPGIYRISLYVGPGENHVTYTIGYQRAWRTASRMQTRYLKTS